MEAKTLSVGTDAEIPIALIDGTFFPITGLVGGTKEEPRPLGKLGPGFMIQEDGAMLEFNIPPAKTPRDFVNYINKALKQIQQEIPPTMQLMYQDYAEYKVEFLKADPSLLRLGCTPDYNVYTRTENPRPKPTTPGLRTAAAHVHIGWSNPTNDEREEMVKWCDFFLGVPWAMHDSAARRDMYGKPGSYRPKEYGIEYRVLGNAWLAHGGAEQVFNGARKAAQAVEAGTRVPADMILLIQKYINNRGVISGDERTAFRNWVYSNGELV